MTVNPEKWRPVSEGDDGIRARDLSLQIQIQNQMQVQNKKAFVWQQKKLHNNQMSFVWKCLRYVVKMI